MNTTNTANIVKVLQVCHYAKSHKTWVVVVTGTIAMAEKLRALLLGSYSEGDAFGGRTLVFKDGGRVSIVPINDDLDATIDPAEHSFDVCFVSLESNELLMPSEEKKIAMWQAGARNMVAFQAVA